MMAEKTQANYFRGAIETLTYTITPREPIKAGQGVGYDGRIARRVSQVQGVAAHDTEEELERGLRIVAIGVLDLTAGSEISVGDVLGPDENGLPSGVLGLTGLGVALSAADKGGLVKVLLK